MEFVAKYRTVAEFAYFLSWPLLILGVAVGIFQLREFKKEALTRFRRESTLLSLEISERKIKSIIDLAYQFGCLSDQHAPVMVNKLTKSSDFDEKEVSLWNEWYDNDENNEAVNFSIDVLNELEAFAHYINSGIVDEELCYQLQWAPVLTNIELFYNYLSFFQLRGGEHVYEHVLLLHNSWSQKSKYDATMKAHHKLGNELKNTTRPEKKRPIGA